jgi:hypothetical protein
MNVYVNLPPRDHGKTEGLCGTFDRDRSNDMKLSNGEYLEGYRYSYWWGRSYYRWTYSQINTFVESWRYEYIC